jgi:hypothetical protein
MGDVAKTGRKKTKIYVYFYLTYNDMSSYPTYLVIQWEGVYDITLDPAMVSPKF